MKTFINNLLSFLIVALISFAVTLGVLIGFGINPVFNKVQDIPSMSTEEIQRLITVQANEIVELLKLREDELGAQLAALPTYSLSGSGVSSSATSFTLTSLTLPQTAQRLLATDLARGGDVFYMTLEPGNRSRQEIISCTTVTQNTTTATLGGCTRGLSPISPYTASTTLQLAHAGGTSVVFSDPPQVFNLFADKTGDAYISGEWSLPNGMVLFASSVPYFTSLPTLSSSTQVATKDYVDGVALAGTPVAATSTTGISGVVRVTEPQEMASSSPYAVHGTTSPLVVGTMYTTSDPIPLRDSATSTWYAVITESDLTINPQFFSTATPDTYRWGGLATFGEADNNFQGFGIGTSSPGTFNLFAVAGPSLLAGTTTVEALRIASSSPQICANTTCYTFPVTDGSSGQQLTTNAQGELSWVGAGGSSKLETIGPEAFPLQATTTRDAQLSTNTTARYALFNAGSSFDVAKITFSVTAVGTTGTLDWALYTLVDGAVTKVLDVTTGSISAAAGFTSISTTTTSMNAGTYYIGVIPNGTADITILTYQGDDPYNTLGNQSSEPVWCKAETSVEASVLPDTFDETTGYDSTVCPVVRIDN